jgi:hypothetical protein
MASGGGRYGDRDQAVVWAAAEKVRCGVKDFLGGKKAAENSLVVAHEKKARG